MNLRDIFDVNRRAIHGFDGQVVQFVEPQRAAVDPDLIFGFGHLRRARRQDQVLQSQGIRDIDRRKLLGVELIQVQVHHDRALLSAERIRNGGALHGAERSADEVIAQVEDLLLAQGLAGKAKLQDGNAGRVELQNVGRKHPGRHLADRGLRSRCHLRHGHVDLDVRMEVDPDDRVAVVRLRLDVLDVVDVRSEAALKSGDDPLLHLLRRQSRIGPQDAHDGNVDVRERYRRAW